MELFNDCFENDLRATINFTNKFDLSCQVYGLSIINLGESVMM